MNRRQVFTSLAALLPVCVASASAAPQLQKYGCLTVEGHIAHQRHTGESLFVYLDGDDVTTQCFEADDRLGYVHAYAKGAQEHAKWVSRGAEHIGVHSGHLCAFKATGRVVIAPRRQL